MNKFLPILVVLCFGLAQEYGRLCVNNNPSICMDGCDYYKLNPNPLENCIFLSPFNNYQSIKYFDDYQFPGLSFYNFASLTVKIDGYETFCTECPGFQVTNIDLFFYGDLDGNMLLNVIDAVLMIDIILEETMPTLDQSVASDINYDGLIDVLDVVLLINEIIGNGSLGEQCIENGSTLINFNCNVPMSISDAIPDDIEPFIGSIVGQGLAAQQLPGIGWIGTLDSFTPYSVYWFNASGLSDVTCFTFNCSE